MIRQEHDFFVDLSDGGGRPLGRSPAAPDWGPMAEHVHFGGIRRGVFAPVLSQPPAEVRPLWHRRRGEPFVGGVRIEMGAVGGGRLGADFPTDCFRPDARRASIEFVEAGRLRDGELFRYRVVAVPRAKPAAPPPGAGGRARAVVEIEEIEQTLVLTESSLRGFLDRSRCLGEGLAEGSGGGGGTDDGDLPVFAAQALVAGAVERVRAAGELETGGILLGRLRTDRAVADGMFLEITAQVPARHAESREMRVTFTRQTWAAARDALALRRSDEQIVGWWHSHPDFCAKCTNEKRAECSLAGIFFSSADVALHRTMFPRAWQVGLLFSNRPAGILPALFGWRRGAVAARPFHLLAPEDGRHDPLLLQAMGAGADPGAAQILTPALERFSTPCTALLSLSRSRSSGPP